MTSDDDDLSLASRAVHADDGIAAHRAVAPAMHVSTTFRYARDPERLDPDDVIDVSPLFRYSVPAPGPGPGPGPASASADHRKSLSRRPRSTHTSTRASRPPTRPGWKPFWPRCWADRR